MKTVLFISALLLAFILGYLAYSGLFARVQFNEVVLGGETLVYEEHLGNYSKVAPVMDEVYRRLKEQENIETEVGFGIYYHKPGEVPTEKLRSEVGCVLPEAFREKAETLAGKYKVKEFPVQRCIVAEMPYRNRTSIMLGIFKAYPKLGKLVAKKGYPQNPVMERYDVANKKIQYIMSIEEGQP